MRPMIPREFDQPVNANLTVETLEHMKYSRRANPSSHDKFLHPLIFVVHFQVPSFIMSFLHARRLSCSESHSPCFLTGGHLVRVTPISIFVYYLPSLFVMHLYTKRQKVRLSVWLCPSLYSLPLLLTPSLRLHSLTTCSQCIQCTPAAI